MIKKFIFYNFTIWTGSMIKVVALADDTWWWKKRKIWFACQLSI